MTQFRLYGSFLNPRPSLGNRDDQNHQPNIPRIAIARHAVPRLFADTVERSGFHHCCSPTSASTTVARPHPHPLSLLLARLLFYRSPACSSASDALPLVPPSPPLLKRFRFCRSPTGSSASVARPLLLLPPTLVPSLLSRTLLHFCFCSSCAFNYASFARLLIFLSTTTEQLSV